MRQRTAHQTRTSAWPGILASAILASSAMATTWTVDDDGADLPDADFNQIQLAIDAASDGDTVLVYPGTYTSTQPGHVANLTDKSITLISANGAAVTVIDGQDLRRGIASMSSETATIDGFTIINGFSSEYDYNGNGQIDVQEGTGGGITCFQGALLIQNCSITSNDASGDWGHGGGIACTGNGSLLIQACTISENTTTGSGGAIYSLYSDCTLSDSSMENNDANYGGGIYSIGNILSLSNCNITANSASFFGGGLVSQSNSPVLDQCNISGNTTDYGGGLYCNDSNPTLSGCSISNNTVGSRGGGIYCRQGNLVMTGCEVDSNTALSREGGGFYCYDNCNATLSECNITQNIARSGGGLACRLNSPTWLTNCVLSGNMTNNNLGYGGGIDCQSLSPPTLVGCTISNNTADFSGGGLACRYLCDPVLLLCTITGNTAGSFGGGLYNISSTATIIDCTMSANSAGAPAWGDGLYAINEAPTAFNGNSTSNGIVCVSPITTLTFAAESTCDVTGIVSPSPEAATTFDIDDLDTTASLLISESLDRQGCLCITNDSSSLDDVNLGNIIPLAQAMMLSGNFSSTVFPSLPEGYGARLVELPDAAGDPRGSTTIAMEIIDVDEAQFDDPIIGGLGNPPLDIVEFDPDGDGTEAIAVLFDGMPGNVSAFTVNDNGSAPTPIAGLSALVGSGPVDIDASDLNGDGHDDLLVANADEATISMLITTEAGDGSYFFTVTTLSLPGNNLTPTCIAAMDWGTLGNAVVGVDFEDEFATDGYQVILDLASSPSIGPLLSIPFYDIDGQGTLVPDPPTAVDGGDSLGLGFVGTTRYGRIHKATPSEGTLSVVAELGGSRGISIEARDLDGNGGDGQVDILVASDEAETIYLVPGDAMDPNGFGPLIPILVSEPIVDVVSIDADDDGDIDLVVAAPLGNQTLVLLRNDDPVSGGLRELEGRNWSKQSMDADSGLVSIASGVLDPKNEEDDWVVGISGGGTGLSGEPIGTMEQTNILEASTPCPEDLDGNGWVDVNDILAVISAYGSVGPNGDVDGNGIVDVNDVLAIISAFGSQC